MLTVNIICIGKLKEKYWKDAVAEYEKRLKTSCKFHIEELPESRIPVMPSDSEIETALKDEGKKILDKAKRSYLVPLCIEGKLISSEKLAKLIENISVQGYSEISFVIGSSYGLSEEVKSQGKVKLSMSEMTFPHQLARIMLCEQIYRAFQILNNTKYHK